MNKRIRKKREFDLMFNWRVKEGGRVIVLCRASRKRQQWLRHCHNRAFFHSVGGKGHAPWFGSGRWFFDARYTLPTTGKFEL